MNIYKFSLHLHSNGEMYFCGVVYTWRTFGSCNSTVVSCISPNRETPLGPEQAKIKLFYLTFSKMEQDHSWVCESWGYQYVK